MSIVVIETCRGIAVDLIKKLCIKLVIKITYVNTLHKGGDDDDDDDDNNNNNNNNNGHIPQNYTKI